MSAHRPSKTGTGGLDDPFVVSREDREDRSAAPGINRRILSEDGETKVGESSIVFGEAVPWSGVASSIQLPSAPTPRERRKYKSLIHQSPEQRPSRRSLSANATPFRPKPESDQTGNSSKQSVAYASPSCAPAQGKVTGEDTQYVHKQNRHGHRIKESNRSISTRTGSSASRWDCRQSSSEPKLLNPYGYNLARLSSANVLTFSTPPSQSMLNLVNDRRQKAHSDEPRPRHLQAWESPSAQDIWFDQRSLSQCSPLQSMPHVLHDPRMLFQPNILNIAYHNHQFRNEMLNHTGQGTFQTDQNGDSPHSNVFDHYTPTPSVPTQNHSTATPQINPYAQDGSTMSSSAYFPGGTNYPQQLQHHLYAALPPHRDLNQPNQRTAKDLFIPENLRQTLARKTEANLMTIPNSSLPAVAHYHSLVPLIHNSQKNAGVFGYLSHAYKATSGNDGKAYCLRRLQGYRLNEAASIHAVQNVQSNWKRVRNGNVVSVHLAFTNSSFGDSSLFFVTDFHPMAETLTQKHFTSTPRYNNRFSPSHVPEQTLWAYIVQIANGLKAIHSAGLAARVIDASKILLTGQNRIRLNACAILDVVRADAHQALADLQRLDLQQFGKLIVALGSNNMLQHNQAKAMEMFSKSYSPRLRELSSGLVDSSSPDRTTTIDKLLAQITTDMVSAFDSSLHQDDALESALVKELENSRLVRLLSKINFINERPEYEHDRHWAEHGNRFVIRLFRDYVFHQVDANGNPVLDLAHVLGALNRLDAASEEKLCLMTRDEESVIVVSFKEVRTCVEGAWGDLVRRSA
ncbi:MAG: hypothetical protein LQ350_006770 [Teloschistes chrysophthalmus]|nr:MAG: hypothetical protein LQ350_006770 [Niorma chrysophthalma]